MLLLTLGLGCNRPKAQRTTRRPRHTLLPKVQDIRPGCSSDRECGRLARHRKQLSICGAVLGERVGQEHTHRVAATVFQLCTDCVSAVWAYDDSREQAKGIALVLGNGRTTKVRLMHYGTRDPSRLLTHAPDYRGHPTLYFP